MKHLPDNMHQFLMSPFPSDYDLECIAAGMSVGIGAHGHTLTVEQMETCAIDALNAGYYDGHTYKPYVVLYDAACVPLGARPLDQLRDEAAAKKERIEGWAVLAAAAAERFMVESNNRVQRQVITEDKKLSTDELTARIARHGLLPKPMP